MKMNYPVKMLAIIMISLMLPNLVSAQTTDKSKRPSPPATATGKIGDATVTIDYSSPSVKGRKIFGGLLPYGKIWRAGANEATTFQTDKDLIVEGKKLPAGKYSFFATPGENEWTIFFNSQTGQGGIKQNGEANIDPAKTVLTVVVKPKKLTDLTEKLTYSVLSTGVDLRWENSDVFISMK
jgi:hypothetical protein